MANQSKFLDSETSVLLATYTDLLAKVGRSGNGGLRNEPGWPGRIPPITSSSLLHWSKLSKLDQGLAVLPSWDLAAVKRRHDEIQTLICSRTTLAINLDQPPVAHYVKAQHMVQWYANTFKLWEMALREDYEGNTMLTRRKISEGLTSFLGTNNLSDILGIYFVLARYGLMEKFCKWCSATLWASALQQKELPPVPDFVKTLGLEKYKYMGIEKSWVNLCKTKYKAGKSVGVKKLMMMITKDIYTTKSASLPVDDSFIEENLEKHKKILCQPHLVDPLTKRFDRLIKKAIELCADDIFGPLPVQDDHTVIKINKRTGITKVKEYKVPNEARPPSRLPSMGASLGCSRARGGAVGDLLTKHGETYSLPEPLEGYLHSYCSYGYKVCSVRVPHDPEIYLEAEKASRSHSYGKDSVQAQVIPLLEAFKVRTITKGDADQYHLARRWQSVIHSRMRKQLNCKLIGQPCDSAYLSQIFGNSPFFKHNGDGFFVSGDYESATDLLHPQLSEFANEAICQRLRIPLEDQLVLKRCLTEHELKYESKGVYYKQQWGQLMGSPTSFPILCLINLAATKVAFEEFFRENGMLRKNEFLLLSELPMCVNGDDILFWCYDDALYSKWKEVTKACGLKFSLGKNYTHNSVAIINSQMYFYEQRKETSFTRSRMDDMPSLLFHLARTVNARLLAGGSRAEARGSGGVDLRDLSDHDLHVYGTTLTRDEARDMLDNTGIRLNKKTRAKYDKMKHATCRLHFLRELQRKDPTKTADSFEAYTKWRTTIEQRCAKGLSLLRGSLRTPLSGAMEDVYRDTFNNIQLKKLDRFRRSGLGSIDLDTPYFLPQSLGGIGLTPTNTHKYTAQEYIEVATLESCPSKGVEWVKQTQPSLLRPSMMKAVALELDFHKKCLNIKSMRKTREQIGYARFFGEDDSFWEHSFLTGFITSNNMIVGEEERTDALRFLQQEKRRNFGNTQLMRALNRQKKIGQQLALIKVEKCLEGRGTRMVVGDAYPDGFEIDIKSVALTYEWVPPPKYE
nr:MAG: putative RNA-dependent RNA polymerase [Narnaviridae sp.]